MRALLSCRRRRRSGEADCVDLSFDRFQTLMVTEFEATPKAIQTLWNLPGFVHRQANLERREVVSLATFQDYMDKLQLMQLPMPLVIGTWQILRHKEQSQQRGRRWLRWKER